MKEKEFINIIKSTLNSRYIGDDCAYLKDLGIVVTQDSLVEDVHFMTKFITPYQLGYKSVMVNISDVCASGAKPRYLTISLSLPKNINAKFVKDFYEGAKTAAEDVEIVGGDITGSDKIYISVTAIGETKNRKISSRSNAKAGYKIIVSGEHGSSAQGLKLLLSNYPDKNNRFIKAHLMPAAQRDFSDNIAKNIKRDYSMMDSSDGLADALFQIAKASNVIISIDSKKIPHDKEITDLNTILYGGEDYQLIAAVPQEFLNPVKNSDFCYTIIGEVKNGTQSGIEIDGKFYSDIENNLYNHFKE